VYAQDNLNQSLDFDVIKTKYMDVNVTIELPIYIEEYSSNSTFSLTTPMFIDTKTQQIYSQEAYYYQDGEKIFAEYQEDNKGNQFAIFDINKIESFEYIFYIDARIISENKIIFPEEVFSLTEQITEEVEYLEPTRYINSDKGEIISISNHIKKTDNILEEVTNIVDWVYNYIEYDISYSEKVVEAVNILKERKGVCSEFAILAAAILRERGIPTRYVTGYASSSVEWQPHAWLEVYIPNHGWIQVDPTFGEVGLVDASHLMMSKAKDPSEIKDRVTAYGNVSLNFGIKNATFKINDHLSFSQKGYSNAINVSLNYPDKIKEDSAFFITAKITNTTNRPLSLLFILSMHPDFKLIYPLYKERIVYLKPFIEKEITFYVLSENTSVPANHSKEYSFSLISQFYDYSDTLSIYKDKGFFQEAFFLTDPFFVYYEDNLNLDFKVINYTNEIKNISLDFNSLFEEIEIEASPKTILSYNQNFNMHDKNKFVLNMSGDYNFSKSYVIFQDNLIEEIAINIDENKEDISDINISSSLNKDNNDDIWNEIESDREKVINKENNNVIGIIIIILFIILIVVIFYSRDREKIYLKN
jgi:hypothetical protein